MSVFSLSTKKIVITIMNYESYMHNLKFNDDINANLYFGYHNDNDSVFFLAFARGDVVFIFSFKIFYFLYRTGRYLIFFYCNYMYFIK